MALHRMDMAAKCEPRSRRLRNASRKSWPHAEAAAAAAAAVPAAAPPIAPASVGGHQRWARGGSDALSAQASGRAPASHALLFETSLWLLRRLGELRQPAAQGSQQEADFALAVQQC
ncbi:MAG: hypothetical protein ACK4MS_16485, partial [Paracoccaceae bacterium]